MREKIHTILMFLLLSPALCHATNIAFYTDGVIQEGDEYVSVGVYNNARVDMTGGIVTNQLTTYDYSTLNALGGLLEAIVSVEFSTVNLSGVVRIGGMTVEESSAVNMFGGEVDSLKILKIGSSNPVNLYGGIISDYLLATSTVNIYGYDFQYNPLAGDYGGGQLTGFWLDDMPFSIDLYAVYNPPYGATIDTWSHVVLREIPEPCTLALLAFGAIIHLRRR